jgi:hypothetical protein
MSRLLDILLPTGGYAVQLVEAYFDESGSNDSSPVLCVAGYVIEKEACKRLDSDWGKVLDDFKLPFFRMSACAHGVRPFLSLTEDACINVEKEMIAIIKRSISCGLAVTVEPRQFSNIMPDSAAIGSAYSFCAHACLTGVQWWANENNYGGDIAYFFEAGHRSQSEANGIMNEIFTDKTLRAKHRYIAHSFVDKQKVKPVQAADLIAWQWYTDHVRRLKRSLRPRKDCYELMHDQNYHVIHYDGALLKRVASTILRNKYPMTFVGWPAIVGGNIYEDSGFGIWKI